MHLYKRGPVWWVVYTQEHVTCRKSTKCRDREAAALFLKRLERQHADPDHAAANQATVESAAGRFLRELKSEDASAGTVNMYLCKVGHVVRLLGSVRLAELTHERVKGFVDAREDEGAVPHTVHRELTALRRILKSAARAREFGRDVASVIPRYAARYVPRTRHLEQAEFASIGPHLDASRYAMLGFILATGCRWGEAVRAQRADVGATKVALRGTKTVRAKREVPIVDLLRPLIDAALAHGDGKAPLLFRPWGNVLRDVALACRKAGCEPFTPNDLRRTCRDVASSSWRLDGGGGEVPRARLPAMLYRVYGQLSADDLGSLINARPNV